VLKELTTTVNVSSALLDTSDTLSITDGVSAEGLSDVHVVIAG